MKDAAQVQESQELIYAPLWRIWEFWNATLKTGYSTQLWLLVLLAVLWLKRKTTAVIMFIDISQIFFFFFICKALGIIFPGNSAKDIRNALKRQKFFGWFSETIALRGLLSPCVDWAQLFGLWSILISEMLLLPVYYDTEDGERGVTNAGKQVAKGQLEGVELSREPRIHLWWGSGRLRLHSW